MKLLTRFRLGQFMFNEDDATASTNRDNTFATVSTKLSFAMLVAAVIIATVMSLGANLDKASTTVVTNVSSASAN